MKVMARTIGGKGIAIAALALRLVGVW